MLDSLVPWFQELSWVLDPWVLLAMGVAFLGGGLIKGTLGVGLPLFAVPVLALVIPAPNAIALLAVPVLLSNAWQALESGKAAVHVTRFIPLLVTILLATALVVPFTLSLSLHTLNILVAASLLIAVFLMAVQPNLSIAPRHEKSTSAVVGGLAGLMAGVSSMAGPLVITYLLALRLPREVFIGSISVIYLFAMVPLYVSLAYYGRLGLSEAVVSLVGLIPMFLGMRFGKALRQRLSESVFRRILLWFLGLLAVLLLFK